MTKITEIQTLIHKFLDAGYEDMLDIYDEIEAKGYKRPQIRQAKSLMLQDIGREIKVLTQMSRLNEKRNDYV